METPHHIVLRRRAMANVVDFAFSTLAHTSGRLPAANPARYGVERLRDISYGPLGADHTVDVYRPIERSGPLPVVVYFHGGAFRSLSKDTHWLMGIAFARRGYIVVSANYRLAPRHPFPAAAHDACDAWRWATEHVGEYGGDPSRMAVAGESAGANLASVIAVASAWRQTEPRARMIYEETPQPVVALPACGILQVSEPERYRRPGTRLAYEIIANLEHTATCRETGRTWMFPWPTRFVWWSAALPIVRRRRFFCPSELAMRWSPTVSAWQWRCRDTARAQTCGCTMAKSMPSTPSSGARTRDSAGRKCWRSWTNTHVRAPERARPGSRRDEARHAPRAAATPLAALAGVPLFAPSLWGGHLRRRPGATRGAART
jgi:hypothetical protein